MKLSSTLNLTLRLQTLHTLLSSKLWYHLLTIELPILGNQDVDTKMSMSRFANDL